MTYTKYNFKEENSKTYKGIKYYKFNDEYIFIGTNGFKYKRFTINEVKKCINEILKNN